MPVTLSQRVVLQQKKTKQNELPSTKSEQPQYAAVAKPAGTDYLADVTASSKSSPSKFDSDRASSTSLSGAFVEDVMEESRIDTGGGGVTGSDAVLDDDDDGALIEVSVVVSVASRFL